MLRRVKSVVGDYWPALKSRNYRLYFLGQGISLVGTWLQAIAEAWLVYPVLTNNKSLLGIVSAVNLAPTLVFALFAGVVADRVDKRRFLIVLNIAFALIVFVMFILVVTHTVQVWHVMIATAFMGLVFAFEMPTRQSLMIELVHREDYPSAIALNAGIFNGARALGPALAGVMIATMGLAPAYFFNSISFLAVIAAVYLMRRTKRAPGNISQRSVMAEFREGFVYIMRNKAIGVLVGLLFLLTVFTWPASTLQPVFAKDIFHRGEVGYGLLQSFFGIGALAGALAFSKIFSRFHNTYAFLCTTLAITVAVLMVFSFSPVFSFSLFLQLMGGWSIVSTITCCNTLIQLNVPATLRGRMLSFYSLALIGGMPFGALIGSVGVAIVGARLTVLFSSILLAVSAILLIAATRGKFREKLLAMV